MGLAIDNDARSYLVGRNIIPDYLMLRLVNHWNNPAVSSLSCNNNARIGGSAALLGFWGAAVTSKRVTQLDTIPFGAAMTTSLRITVNNIRSALIDYGLIAND